METLRGGVSQIRKNGYSLGQSQVCRLLCISKQESDLKVLEKKQLWGPNHQNTENYKMINIMTVTGCHSIQKIEQSLNQKSNTCQYHPFRADTHIIHFQGAGSKRKYETTSNS